VPTTRIATFLLAAVILTLLAAGTAGAKPKPKPKHDRPPKAPVALRAAVSAGSVTLSWKARKGEEDERHEEYEEHDKQAATVGYGIYEDGAPIAQTVATSYTVEGVPCGTRHEFAVDAVDARGNRSDRATVTVTMPACESGGLTVYVAPNGLDGGVCTKTAPCGSFDFAYHVATPGATIEIAGGTYPAQTVNLDLTKLDATSDVVFQPAAGATVQIDGDLSMYGSHAVFRNLKLHKLVSEASAGALTSHDVVFENLDGETFNIGPNYRITIKGGDWGPSLACHARDSTYDPATWCPAGSPHAATGNDGNAGDWENHVGPDGNILSQWPHDILITGARIHDQNSTDLDAMHTGGLFLISGHDIAIRNTVFQQNAVYDLQVQDFTSPDCCGMTFGPAHDVVLENNWFGAPVRGVNDPGGDTFNDNQPELQLDPRHGACWTNWLIRYNSFVNGVAPGLDAGACFDNVRFVGNVGEAPGPPQCFTGAAGLTWDHNAWLGGTCDPTDATLTSLPYTNTKIGAEDFHLTSGPAVDLVPGTTADERLGTDIDGQARPLGPAWDAGADEAH
jgi:hypothetical protein